MSLSTAPNVKNTFSWYLRYVPPKNVLDQTQKSFNIIFGPH